MADKVGWSEFTHDDEALVGALSQAAGVAIEPRLTRSGCAGRPYPRPGTAWHGTSTTPSSNSSTRSGSPCRAWRHASRRRGGPARGRRGRGSTVSSHRSAPPLHELGMGDDSRGVRDDITTLTRELRPVVGCEIDVMFEGGWNASIDAQIRTEHLRATIREALTNVGKHAQATRVSVSVDATDTSCRLTITDDGRNPAGTVSSAAASVSEPPAASGEAPRDSHRRRRPRRWNAAHVDGAARHLAGAIGHEGRGGSSNDTRTGARLGQDRRRHRRVPVLARRSVVGRPAGRVHGEHTGDRDDVGMALQLRLGRADPGRLRPRRGRPQCAGLRRRGPAAGAPEHRHEHPPRRLRAPGTDPRRSVKGRGPARHRKQGA